MLANQLLAAQFLKHQAHYNSGQRDLECSWCVYSAYLDNDRAFLKRIPAGMRADMLAPIKAIVEAS